MSVDVPAVEIRATNDDRISRGSDCRIIGLDGRIGEGERRSP